MGEWIDGWMCVFVHAHVGICIIRFVSIYTNMAVRMHACMYCVYGFCSLLCLFLFLVVVLVFLVVFFFRGGGRGLFYCLFIHLCSYLFIILILLNLFYRHIHANILLTFSPRCLFICSLVRELIQLLVPFVNLCVTISILRATLCQILY